MRNVVVTGGSRGLGLAICRRLAEAGHCVIAVARSRGEDFDKAAAGTAGGCIVFAPFDLNDIAAMPAFVKALRKEHGPLYGLVNNAGIGTSGLLAAMPLEQIERLIRLNTLSPIALTRQVIRSMLSEGQGRIINMSSIIAATGYNGLSVYAATKGSLNAFTRSLAREVGRAGITVNAVAPGFIDTAMTEELAPEQRQQIARRSALQRLAEPDDVARMVEFLLGDGARNITGTVFTVDAGNTA
jgi:3-oxoacyl-[acyl-carrier protein] reductase